MSFKPFCYKQFNAFAQIANFTVLSSPSLDICQFHINVSLIFHLFLIEGQCVALEMSQFGGEPIEQGDF